MSYLDMFNNGQYLDVIADLKDSKNPDDIWLVVDSYIQLNKVGEALKIIEKNLSILLESDPKKTMLMNIDLFLLQEDYASALRMYDYFEKLPYISMEIEELLPTLKDYIFKKMSKQNNVLSDEEIIANLANTQNEELIMRMLYEIQKRGVNKFFLSLKSILINENVSDEVRTLVLILLVEKGEKREVKIIKNGHEYQVVPNNLKPIATKEEIMQKINAFIKEKDVSVILAMQEFMASYAFNIYPENLFSGDEHILLAAFYYFTLDVFKHDFDEFVELIVREKLNREEVLKQVAQIKESLSHIKNAN